MNSAQRECIIMRETQTGWRRPIDVAESAGLCRKRIAKDMRILKEAGLLKRRGHGPAIHYRLKVAS
jgi:hypothetical protein